MHNARSDAYMHICSLAKRACIYDCWLPPFFGHSAHHRRYHRFAFIRLAMFVGAYTIDKNPKRATDRQTNSQMPKQAKPKPNCLPPLRQFMKQLGAM